VEKRQAATKAALTESTSKRCPRCVQELPFDQFHRNKAMPDGFQSYCKECSNQVRREYEARNSEALKLRRAERIVRLAEQNNGGSKQCRKCLELKPMLAFYVHRGTSDGRANYCATCQSATTQEWAKNNAAKVRARNAQRSKTKKKRDHRQWWLRLYNLTQEDYTDLLEAQGGACAICRRPESVIDSRTGEPRNLSVDHDHITGRVRGLLCGRCNRGLGQFADSPEMLRLAAQYLDASQEAAPAM